MEHIVMMLTAIVVISIGSAKAKANSQIKRSLKPWQFGLPLHWQVSFTLQKINYENIISIICYFTRIKQQNFCAGRFYMAA
jgi:hypothetical protein